MPTASGKEGKDGALVRITWGYRSKSTQGDQEPGETHQYRRAKKKQADWSAGRKRERKGRLEPGCGARKARGDNLPSRDKSEAIRLSRRERGGEAKGGKGPVSELRSGARGLRNVLPKNVSSEKETICR